MSKAWCSLFFCRLQIYSLPKLCKNTSVDGYTVSPGDCFTHYHKHGNWCFLSSSWSHLFHLIEASTAHVLLFRPLNCTINCRAQLNCFRDYFSLYFPPEDWLLVCLFIIMHMALYDCFGGNATAYDKIKANPSRLYILFCGYKISIFRQNMSNIHQTNPVSCFKLCIYKNAVWIANKIDNYNKKIFFSLQANQTSFLYFYSLKKEMFLNMMVWCGSYWEQKLYFTKKEKK